ncbi:hypothetical protein CsSME_00045307 [Camellia sinensis var. sinensis]
MWLGGGTGGGAKTAFVRKINPKVTPQEAASIAQGLYQVIKQHGPLTVSNTWNHAKASGSKRIVWSCLFNIYPLGNHMEPLHYGSRMEP